MYHVYTLISFWMSLVSILVSRSQAHSSHRGCLSVTAVGATTGHNPETAASLSSGGFSNVFATAPFQSADVAAYIQTLGDEYKGLYNASGRGFPDVSTQGENFVISYEGNFYSVDGTSCSSPTFASIIALINDARLSAGKSRLGWLNPFLYSNAHAFNDVTSGSNPGCGTDGFPAEAGWDPVSTELCCASRCQR